MIQKSAKNRGKYFVRVMLSSGNRMNPMGDEELAVFCQCDTDEPTAADVDKMGLLRWVSNNPSCKRNQSNEQYRISKHGDAMSVIFLSDREIEACRSANRIYSC